MDAFSLRPKAQSANKVHLEEHGEFLVHNTLTDGFSSVRSQICAPHELEAVVKNMKSDGEKVNMAYLRSAQGVHAPLKLMLEKKAVSKVQRLPFLLSSNVALQTLEGTDEQIGIEDFLNDPMEGIEALATPQAVMERHLHLY